MKTKKTLIAALVVAIAALLAPFYGPGILAQAATPGNDDLPAAMIAMASAYDVVEQNAADKVDAEKAIYDGAIPGMLHALDPHSNFIKSEEFKDMQRKQTSQ